MSRLPLLLCLLAAGIGQALAQDRHFRDCADCPQMVRIPPGSFTMGVPAAEEEREGGREWQVLRGRSAPETDITFERGFALGASPVTRAEYLAFEEATGRPRAASCRHIGRHPYLAGRWQWREQRGLTWWEPSFAQTELDPVVCVNWEDAQAYVAWLSQRTGQRYRLPSEAEWEYAARAGTAGPRWWPGGLKAACGHANVLDRTIVARYYPAWLAHPERLNDRIDFPCSDGHLATAPVDRFPANPFGLHDMLGNVRQWMQDCWNATLEDQPANGEARESGICSQRIVRGSSWNDGPWSTRAGYRDWLFLDRRETVVGFRVARAL